MGFRKIIFLTLTFACAVVYSILVIFKLLFNWITTLMWNPWTASERKVPPKCITEPEVGTHKYIKLENIKLHYVEAGDKSNTLMLFLHGFPEFWYSWRYQLKEFSKDYWTVAVDMRGYGDSDKPAAVAQYDIKYLVQDIKNLVTALGREKFILVGHDWGGIVAFKFVEHHYDMLEKYIVMNTVCSEQLAMDIKQLLKSWYAWFFKVPYLPELYFKHRDFEIFDKLFKSSKNKLSPEEIDVYKYLFSTPGTLTAAINYYRNINYDNVIASVIKNKGNTSDYPPGIFIFGENDNYITLDSLTKMQERTSNLEIVVIKDANHFVQQDSPKEVNDVMRSFLKK